MFNNKQSIKSNKIKQQSQCLSNKSEHIFERERERDIQIPDSATMWGWAGACKCE